MDLIWFPISICFITLLVVGYFLPSINDERKARIMAWLIAIITTAFSSVISTSETPLTRMLIIVVLQLISMKIIVAVETYPGQNRLLPFQWAAFCVGWFGMRPRLFEKLTSSSLPFSRHLVTGVSRILLGVIFLYISVLLERNFRLETFFIPQLSMLIGLSLILHFGILGISTAFWRMLGVDVSELFRAPYKSKSLREFWGKRWNIAYSEMTTLIAYRPLKKLLDNDRAVTASFLLSGLLHEVAISLPVMAGFGLPMIYFGIHAFAMYLETNSRVVQRIIQHPWLSHLWVFTLLVIPLPILFHYEFHQRVLMPLRDFILRWVGIV